MRDDVLYCVRQARFELAKPIAQKAIALSIELLPHVFISSIHLLLQIHLPINLKFSSTSLSDIPPYHSQIILMTFITRRMIPKVTEIDRKSKVLYKFLPILTHIVRYNENINNIIKTIFILCTHNTLGTHPPILSNFSLVNRKCIIVESCNR